MTANVLDATVAALAQGQTPHWIAERVRRYRATGGAEGHLRDTTPVGGDGPRPCLLLTMPGRKSGTAYTHPLPGDEDTSGWAIVASKGGLGHTAALVPPGVTGKREWRWHQASAPAYPLDAGRAVALRPAVRQPAALPSNLTPR